MSDPVPIPALSAPPGTPTDREQFWRQTIAAFTSSGLSVRDFCRRHGLHEKRFYTWRRNLGLSPVGRPTSSDTSAPGFVPVRVVSDTPVEVVLPDGTTLRVPPATDPSHVARLVAALRGVPC